MPFSDLENFKVLAEKLNFTRAASMLFISQSTLSKSISRLEDKLGFELFTRNTREVELTAAGKSFYKDTVELLDMYEQSIKRARSCTNDAAYVRIGGHFANPRIYALVDELRSRIRDLGAPFRIETNARHVGSIERKPGLDDPYEDALTGQDDIDVLYGSEEIASSPLATTPLFGERLVAYVSKDSPLASKESVELNELRTYTFVTTTTYYAFKWALMDLCKAHGFEPQTRLRVVDSMSDLMHLRANDEVIVIVESLVALAPPSDGIGLTRLDVVGDDASIQVVAAHLPEKRTPNVATCLEQLQLITQNW